MTKIFFRKTDWEHVAIARGFLTHDRETRAALARAGVLTHNVAEADASIFVGPPHSYTPIAVKHGAKNVLFTAIEGTTPHQMDIDAMRRADVILVPCEQNREALSAYHQDVRVVPLGTDPARFPMLERTAPRDDQTFRFLYCGQLSHLKGATKLLKAFEFWAQSGTMPKNAELYVKTPGEAIRDGKPFRGTSFVTFKNGKPFPSASRELPGIMIDNRDLTIPELLDVYRAAHCFVLPSYGEGWALTVSEAMSTGLPCIYTDFGGPQDYADETTGYPLVKNTDFHIAPMPGRPHCNAAHVSINALVKKMQYVYEHYDEALEKGRKASERMHTEFTWDQTAVKIIETLEEVSK